MNSPASKRHSAGVGATGPHARLAVNYLASRTARTEELLPLLGIQRLDETLPERIPARNYLNFIERAAEMTGDPLFGLHLGANARIDDFFGYGFLLCSCKDARTVIEQTIRFEALCHDIGHTEVVVEGDVAHYRFISHVAGFPGERHFLEAAVAAICTTADWLLRMSLPVFEFTFPHALPEGADIEEYRHVLKGPVTFNGDHVEGRIPAALLDMPLPGSDQSIYTALEKAAAQRLQALNASARSDLEKTVRAHIEDRLGLGKAKASLIARAMGVSARTLNRRLAEEGLKFSDLLNDIRRDLARSYVSNKRLALTEVALMLGYNEQSNFNHAFRRWYDLSPTEQRTRDEN